MYRQVTYGSTHDGIQSIMFKKTPLDRALEAVEAKYDSIDKAPANIVRGVQRVAKSMGLPVKMESPNANSAKYRPIHYNLPKTNVKPVPADFKLWTGKNHQKFTNYKPLVKAVRYTRKGYSPRDSCKLADFPYSRFKQLHLLRKGYIWNCGNIHQRVYSIKALIHYCKSLNWSFGPCSYDQWTFNRYKGVIEPYRYFVLVHYRKGE